MAIRITDLVDPDEIEKLKQLDAELSGVLTTYTKVAKDLAKGLEISVNVVGDVDRLEKFLVDKGKEAATIQQQLTHVIEEHGKVIANTTNSISRQLAEQERVNKTQRESYTDTEKFRSLMEKINGTYEHNVKRLVETNQAIAANKKQQDDLKKSIDMGQISQEQYNKRLVQLTMTERELKQSKSELTSYLKNEEREMQSVEGSYRSLSQRLELLKKSYKDLTAEERDSELGKEMSDVIQNLDAHLKDLAADMGEFQRNVGNYAIAGQNGVVSTESLMAVLQQQAITTKDVADQSKILLEARGMLDTSDANYSESVALINDRLAENSRRLADVSDIMGVQANTVAEAEAQNQRLQEALKLVDLTSADAQTTIKELNAKIEENNKVIEAGSGSKASIKKDLKELVLEIANLTIEYQNLTEEEKASAEGRELANHIHDLTEKAGVLKDAISDTNAAISNAASDTRTFDQLSGAIQLAIDGFGLAKGAAAMLGISEEELAEVQTKLQAAIAASNAMQSIQNTLQAQSALMQGVNLVQTKLRTVAENLHTAAQGKGVIATTALTAAQWAFNAAASANPIGLIVVAIIACVAAVWGLVKAFTAFLGPSDEALRKYQEQKKALDDMCDANDKLIERMKARGATEAELLNQSLLNKQAEKEAADALFASACELYDEDEDEYKEALDAKKKADEEFEAHKEDSLNYLLGVIHASEEEEKKQRLGTYEYKRQLIQAELEQQKAIAATLLAQEKITRQVYENLVASLDKAAQMKVDAVNADEQKEIERKAGAARKGAVSAAKQTADELKKAVQAGEDALLNIISDSLERQRQAEMLSYDRQISALREQLAKTKATQVSLRTALNNQIEGLTAEHNRKMEDLQMSVNERHNKAEADFISSHLAIVKAGTEEELEWRHKELSNQYHAELIAIQKSEMDKTLTTEQAEEMRINLALKYADLREKAEEDHADKMAELIEQRYATEQTEQDNAYISAVNALKRRYAQELAAAKGNAAQQEAVKAKFEQDQARLSEQYAQQTARNSIAMLEEVLESEKLSAEDRLKYEQALAKAKIDLETAMADASIAQIERITEADNQASDHRLQNAQRWLQVAADSLNTISDLVATVYDAKIAKVEEEQEANTAAGDAEIERITELVEKKAISEEEGEARKRAAEAQTAKKEEELEKKKQQLKHKQAVWDKANSVAQAGINTAMSITQTAAQLGYPAAIPFIAIAGAMGAVQIATIIATPIPKYAKGTDRHKGGPAIVGDGGVPELVIFGGKSWVTPNTPTVVDLPAGAIVKPNIDGIDDNTPGLTPLPIPGEVSTPVIINNDYKRLEDRMDMFIYLMRRHSNWQRQYSIDNSLYRFIPDRI